MAASKKTITITMREGDWGLLADLAGHHPLLTRHRVAEMALHHGLVELHGDRDLLDQAIAAAAAHGRSR